MHTVSPLFPPPSPLYLTVLNASTKTPGLLEVCTHIVAPLVLCGTLIYELSLKSQGITLEKMCGHLQHLFLIVHHLQDLTWWPPHPSIPDSHRWCPLPYLCLGLSLILVKPSLGIKVGAKANCTSCIIFKKSYNSSVRIRWMKLLLLYVSDVSFFFILGGARSYCWDTLPPFFFFLSMCSTEWREEMLAKFVLPVYL